MSILSRRDRGGKAVRVFRLPQDCQGYLRVFLPLDHLDNVVQVHVDDVNGLSLSWATADDLVLRFSRSRTLGASSDQLLNEGKAIVTAEEGRSPQRASSESGGPPKSSEVARVRIRARAMPRRARNSFSELRSDTRSLQLVAVNICFWLRKSTPAQQSISIWIEQSFSERHAFRRRLHIGALVHVTFSSSVRRIVVRPNFLTMAQSPRAGERDCRY